MPINSDCNPPKNIIPKNMVVHPGGGGVKLISPFDTNRYSKTYTSAPKALAKVVTIPKMLANCRGFVEKATRAFIA